MYRLREIERADICIINEWRSNKELINCLGEPFRYINIDVDYKWFDTYLQNRNNTVRCSIINEDNLLLGLVSLTNIDYINQSAVLHIMIGSSENRNKGLGTFAIKEILKHAFYDIHLNRIELTVLEDNEIAKRVYSKIGFKQEGIKRNAIFKNGDYINMIIMSILKNEFIVEVVSWIKQLT